jgi:hypothetical protein
MNRINVYTETGQHLDGWFDLDKAVGIPERLIWDGNNNVSVHVGRCEHQRLYRTSGGRWVLHTWSQWVGTQPTYAYISDDDAKTWLLRNESDDIITQYFGPLEDERGPGQPAIGKPVPIRFDPSILARVDARATGEGVSRAEMVRRLVDAALTTN